MKESAFFASGIVCIKIIAIFAPSKRQDGAIAQLVEQRTENPCVPRSIRGGTTEKAVAAAAAFFLYPKRLLLKSPYVSGCRYPIIAG